MHVVINAIPIRPGGGLTVVEGLARSLCQARPDWRVTVLAGQAATRDAVAAWSETCGQLRVDSPPAWLNASSAAAFAWQRWRLAADLRRRRADVVIAINHRLAAAPCPQVVYHLNLRRFHAAFRSSRPGERIKEALRDRAARSALRHADANVFESHFLKSAAETAIGGSARNAHVVYIGLPDELLATPRADSAGTPTASARLVAITSPQPHKDNPTLIRTLAELVRRAPERDWRLDVAGGTDARAWLPLRALADSLGVGERMTWHGFCPQARLTTLLASALCLVSTSQLESFAMVALEAMSRGCPPIVADAASMPESVGDAGLLARPGDAESFAAAVMSLATDARRRAQLVARGREWVRGFSWSTCGRTFAELIESLPAARPHAEEGRRDDVVRPAA